MRTSTAALLSIVLGLLVQTSDPWWRPLNPFGQSVGITYGFEPPDDPRAGELWVDMNGATSGGPTLNVYDQVVGDWAASSGLEFPLSAPNGTAVAPSYGFENGGGLYSVGSNTVLIAANGAPKLQVDSSDITAAVDITAQRNINLKIATLTALNLVPPSVDGALAYCSDCSSQAGAICADGDDGALAVYDNGSSEWRCP